MGRRGFGPRGALVALVLLGALAAHTGRAAPAGSWTKGKSKNKGKKVDKHKYTPGPDNWPNAAQTDRNCKLTDRSSGRTFDLEPLASLGKQRRQFFAVRGAPGGLYDVAHMRYDYFFTVCGGSPSNFEAPLECIGGGVLPASAYQVGAPRKAEGAGSDEEFQERSRNAKCYSIGNGMHWTYRLIDHKEDWRGVQLNYQLGQNCTKRSVVKTTDRNGRKKREVKWEEVPRSVSINIRCFPSGEKVPTEPEVQGMYMERLSGEAAAAEENEMCHYQIDWYSPYGCYEGLKEPKKAEQEEEDYEFVDDWRKRPRRRKRRGVLSKLFANLVTFSLIGAVFALALQIFRHRRWMKIIIPQMVSSSPTQKRVACKKFMQLIFTWSSYELNRYSRGKGGMV